MSAPCRGWQWVACLCPHSSSSIFAVPFISHQPPLASPTIVIQNCNTSTYGSTFSTSFSASLYKIMSLSPCHLTPKLDLPKFIFFSHPRQKGFYSGGSSSQSAANSLHSPLASSQLYSPESQCVAASFWWWAKPSNLFRVLLPHRREACPLFPDLKGGNPICDSF